MSRGRQIPSHARRGALRRAARPGAGRLLVAAALAAGAPAATPAATVTWDGDGPSNVWSAVGIPPTGLGNSNWVGSFVIPANGDDLVFAGTRKLANTNDYLASTGALTFAAGAGAFVLGGNALTLRGDLRNASASLQTIDLALTVGAPAGSGVLPTLAGGAGGLRINGTFALEAGAQVVVNGVQLANTAKAMVLGDAGIGSVTADATTIEVRSLTLGVRAGSSGNLALSGAGSRLHASDEIVVGNLGRGELGVQDATVQSGTVRIAAQAGSVGTVRVAGGEWTIARGLSVGQLGSANLRMYGGARVSSDEGAIGADGGAGGTVVVLDSARWAVGSRLTVGATGSGTSDVPQGSPGVLQIQGGTVTAPTLSILKGGVVRLSSGELAFGDYASSGRLEWTGGTLTVRSTGGAALGSGALAGVLTLSGGMTLAVDHGLTVGAGRVLVLDGGSVRSGGLALDGGTVVAVSGFDAAATGGLTGWGVVSGAVTGGSGARITASGALTLGDLAQPRGFAFDGKLDAGHSAVVLLASEMASLGTYTVLGSSSQLAAPNGAFLDAGRTLAFDGDASVLGNFVNAGSVTGAGGTLTFLNDVAGPGSFAGDVVFHAGYSPGNSPARIDFGGGDARFDPTSVLTLELNGAAAGSGHDLLAGIDALQFHGRLRLLFGQGYAPAAGERLALFDFQSFAGSLAADRIDVVGYDRASLDFSRLAIDGTLAAVPEPASWLLLCVGALALVARRGLLHPRGMPEAAAGQPVIDTAGRRQSADGG